MKLDLPLTETENLVGAIWSDHCLYQFTDIIIIGDDLLLCTEDRVYGTTTVDILSKLGAEA